MITKEISNQIDSILPQTQCQMCEFPSCKDYANAIAENKAKINKCHPGGANVLTAIAKITKQNPDDYITTVTAQYKSPSKVIIDESICIGCTKCITACPVDAIIGGAKKMHTVLPTECTGCDLCIPACPVDCIYPQQLQNISYNPKHAKSRYIAKQNNITNIEQITRATHLKNKLNTDENGLTVAARKAVIKQALNRAQNK
jgi:Na+-translocating ferredoxin:NAD+ oxidoreductase subunit B